MGHLGVLARVRSGAWGGGWLLCVWLPCVWLPCTAQASGGYKAFMAGRKALAEGDADLALKHLRNARKTLSHWGLVHLEIAVAYRQLGEFGQEARVAVQEAVRLLPQNPRAHLFAGFFWEGAGESKKAHHHFLRAVELGHPSQDACLHAARLALRFKRHQDVLPCLQILRRQTKYERAAHLLLAQNLEAISRIQESAYHWRWLSARSYALFELQLCLSFFLRYADQQSPKNKRSWRADIQHIERKLRSLAPHSPKRDLRPLLPSKR